MTARWLVLGAALLWGCAARTPSRPAPLDAYAGAGPLAVRGAKASAPGPRVVRAVGDDPRVVRVLAANGEPETLEIVTRPGRDKQIVLTFPRGRDGRARRVVVDLGAQPPVVRAPAREARAASTRRSAAPEAVRDPPAAGGPPTAQQSLECPIDPDRADCRALCAGQGSYEWCR